MEVDRPVTDHSLMDGTELFLRLVLTCQSVVLTGLTVTQRSQSGSMVGKSYFLTKNRQF